jgi:glycyl-tRNA synthetase
MEAPLRKVLADRRRLCEDLVRRRFIYGPGF